MKIYAPHTNVIHYSFSIVYGTVMDVISGVSQNRACCGHVIKRSQKMEVEIAEIVPEYLNSISALGSPRVRLVSK